MSTGIKRKKTTGRSGSVVLGGFNDQATSLNHVKSYLQPTVLVSNVFWDDTTKLLYFDIPDNTEFIDGFMDTSQLPPSNYSFIDNGKRTLTFGSTFFQSSNNCEVKLHNAVLPNGFGNGSTNLTLSANLLTTDGGALTSSTNVTIKCDTAQLGYGFGVGSNEIKIFAQTYLQLGTSSFANSTNSFVSGGEGGVEVGFNSYSGATMVKIKAKNVNIGGNAFSYCSDMMIESEEMIVQGSMVFNGMSGDNSICTRSMDALNSDNCFFIAHITSFTSSSSKVGVNFGNSATFDHAYFGETIAQGENCFTGAQGTITFGNVLGDSGFLNNGLAKVSMLSYSSPNPSVIDEFSSMHGDMVCVGDLHLGNKGLNAIDGIVTIYGNLYIDRGDAHLSSIPSNLGVAQAKVIVYGNLINDIALNSSSILAYNTDFTLIVYGTIGTSPMNNFNTIFPNPTNCKLITSIANQTINNGGADDDCAIASANGCVVSYVL